MHDFGMRAPDGSWVIMGRYRINPGKEEIKGEGTSSICRRAVCLQTGDAVAVKVYKKSSKHSARQEEVKMQKFKRQIAVLKELQEALQEPADSTLWSDQLDHVKPSRLFMQLIDFSKDAHGNPGLDPRDNMLYVVTELAQYSLKDYLALRKDQGKPLQRDSVRSICKAIMLVIAGLHSKGLVHIDLKPENLMMFNGRLKLIDVDGCVKVGTSVSIQDSSISFSPCYCAPEWVRFLIEDSASRISVSTSLDVWSVGMTLCELVSLDAILKPMYATFLRGGHSNAEAGFLFMEWLGSINKVPFPKSVEKFDPEFWDLLVNWLLVFDPTKRATCAQCLSHPYILAANEGRKSTKNSRSACYAESDHAKPMENTLTMAEIDAAVKTRVEDNSAAAPLYKGALFKLDVGAQLENPISWRRRDFWIAANGSLCYFSIKDTKRLVLIDGWKLAGAQIVRCENAARPWAFAVQTRCDEKDGAPVQASNSGNSHVQASSSSNSRDGVYFFASENEEDYLHWVDKLKSVVPLDGMMTTMRLGASIQHDLETFRLQVKNRRMSIDAKDKDRYTPVFKGTLWKVKAEGDRKKAEDWFEREMWISKNGSLVYWSIKEERALVYYTPEDIMKANIIEIPNADTHMPWAFTIQRPKVGDLEFAPGEFAAESEEMRESWLQELARCKSELR